MHFSSELHFVFGLLVIAVVIFQALCIFCLSVNQNSTSATSYYCQFWLQTIFLIFFVVVYGTNRSPTRQLPHGITILARLQCPFSILSSLFAPRLSFFLSQRSALRLCLDLQFVQHNTQRGDCFCCVPMDFLSLSNSLPKSMIHVQCKTFSQNPLLLIGEMIVYFNYKRDLLRSPHELSGRKNSDQSDKNHLTSTINQFQRQGHKKRWY